MECSGCAIILLEEEYVRPCTVCANAFCERCIAFHAHQTESKEPTSRSICVICEEHDLLTQMGRICVTCKQAVCELCMHRVESRCPFCRADEFGSSPGSPVHSSDDEYEYEYTPATPEYLPTSPTYAPSSPRDHEDIVHSPPQNQANFIDLTLFDEE